MIDTENLTKESVNMTAVDSVTLHVDGEEEFGFLGHNGAGKTTTIRMLAFLIAGVPAARRQEITKLRTKRTNQR